MKSFWKQWRRDLLVQYRQPYLILHSALFFLILVAFFPLTLPAKSTLFHEAAPGLIWMAILLAMLLQAERLFQADYEDGVIEQWLVSGESLPLIVAGKISVHWVLVIIPLMLFCPLLALFFKFSLYQMGVLFLSLLTGTPALFFLCALVASFSTSIQQKGIFMALILLPLTIPVMILGSGILTATNQSLPVAGYLAILLALSIIAISFLPFAIATIIRISLAD